MTARSQTPISDNFTVSAWFIEKYDPNGLEDYSNAHGEYYAEVDDRRTLVANAASVPESRLRARASSSEPWCRACAVETYE